MASNFIDFPYIRPIKEDSTGFILIEVKHIFNLQDKYTEVIIPTEISYMIWNNAPSTIQIPDFDICSQNAVLQANYNNIKHSCMRVAELINAELLDFLETYYQVTGCPDKELLIIMDFYNLRAVFSNILRKDQRFWELDIFNNPENRKLFRKTFAEFIEDRNIYTHGHLKVRMNDEAILIEYNSRSTQKKEYCRINGAILQTFFNAYQTIRLTLREMSDIIKLA